MLSDIDSGRSLIEQAKERFHSLTDVDKTLFEAIGKGESANFKRDQDTINANRIVWLLTTPKLSEHIGFRRLQISNVTIEGELELEYATVSVPLIFNACVFTKPLRLNNSKLRELQLKDTHVAAGIQAEEIQVEGCVSLSGKFKAEGEVNFLGASIGGQLACSGGQFSNKDKIAINAAAATISADVLLRNGFKAEGEVSLIRASIGGHFDCFGGQFSNKGKRAINANAAKIAASVFLRDGFKAKGEVNLRRALIGGGLYCSGGEFSNPGKTAINANAATVEGSVGCDPN